MKKIIFFAVFAFISIACFSQDIISLKKGSRLEVIVTEITPTLVRYKLFSEPNGRSYFAYKEDVAGIMYQNGRVETFNQSGNQKVETQNNSNDNQNQYQSQNQYQQSSPPARNQDYSEMPNNRTQSNYSQPNYSQSDYSSHSASQSGFSQFHVGLAFPSGKFADGDPNNDGLLGRGKGFAAMGFNAGYKYYSPLQGENFSWVFGIEAFYNGLNSDAKDAIDNLGIDDVTYPMYFNFPATLGLNYAVPLQGSTKLYVEAAIGGNFSMLTKMSLSDRDGDATSTFTPAFGFAYGLEGGFFINDKYSIGLRYNNLGSYKYKYEVKAESQGYTDTEKGKLDKALSITNISLCLGILF